MKYRMLNYIIFALLCSCAHKTYSPQDVTAESQRINVFFEKSYQKKLDRHPMDHTYLGNKKFNDRLNNLSDEFAVLEHELVKKDLESLKAFNYESLDEQAKMSYKIFKERASKDVSNFKYRYHSYLIDPMTSIHSSIAAFMVGMHKIDSKNDAEAYISRLLAFRLYFHQLVDQLKIRRDKKLYAPYFIYDKAIEQSQNIISHRPFRKSKKESTLLADFKKKLRDVKSISVRDRKRLISKVNKALLSSVKPAYEQLIDFMREAKELSKNNHGAWALEDGKNFYKARLAFYTTTDLSPKEIHQTGLDEVARIHKEMRGIMTKVGYKGTLQQFFKHMRESSKYYYPNTVKGKKSYLKQATKIISDMKKELAQLFGIRPEADIVVRPVEAFREKSAGRAFYEAPAIDGSRPGVYYVNLYDMKSVPKYALEALAYHEGIPGHHMQVATALELKNTPLFRKNAWYNAYGEGWALYSEYIPKEAGFYKNPYSDFGRLSMELWRAGRLVVDTGLHQLKWSREKAIAYMSKNTPRPIPIVTKEIERFIVWPGQAVSYKVGMMKILELRDRAKKALGTKFDIRHFHDEVLRYGPLPLGLLDERINLYIERSR